MSGLSEIAKACGIKTDVAADVFEEIMKRLDGGDEVRIKGFGTFKTTIYPGRTLQSPRVNDGEPITFGDSRALKFRQSQLAKQRLNQNPVKASEGKTAKSKSEAKAKDKIAKAKPEAASEGVKPKRSKSVKGKAKKSKVAKDES